MMDAFRRIQKSGPSLGEEELSNQYPDLKEKFPFLFHKVCTDPNMDLSKLEYMLQLRDAMHNDDIDNQEASRQVGQTMFDAYVKPMLDAKDSK